VKEFRLAGHDAKNDSSSGSSTYPCSSTSVCEFLEVMIARLNNSMVVTASHPVPVFMCFSKELVVA
jgi:hypothetical protein